MLFGGLGRVSLVDKRGLVLFDAYVQPTSRVESYRQATTGLDASFFANGGLSSSHDFSSDYESNWIHRLSSQPFRLRRFRWPSLRGSKAKS